MSSVVRIVYGDGPGGPGLAPDVVLAAAGLTGAFEVTLGWVPDPLPWLGDPTPADDGRRQPIGRTVFPGAALRDAVRSGTLAALPMRLSAVAPMLRSEQPDVAVVAGVRRGDGFAFHRSVGWADVAARHAARVVVEVDEAGIDLGGPAIEGEIVGVVPRRAPPTEPPTLRPDEIDRRIGRHVAELLPDDATLQLGLGKVPSAVLAAIDRPVRIWSGLVDDGVAGLHDRGLLAAPAVAAYTWGGSGIERLHRVGMLELVSAARTHDAESLVRIPGLIACNSALQVGLDGAINVERVGGRVIAGLGGHRDFCAGATSSVGGTAIVALRSTTGRGASTIVGSVEQVSTPAREVGVVVTEHGVADLRDGVAADWAERLISIAAPEHRDALRATCG